MVGYFSQELENGRPRDALPVGADCTLSPLLPAAAPEPAPPPPPPPKDPASVNRLVCSPDIPVFPMQATAPPPAKEETPADSTADNLQCTFCDKSFTQKTAYQNHMRIHGKEGEDPYQCNFCGKTFAVPARLTRHYRTHTGEKPYQCEYCKKSFSVKENLSVHRRIHTKERPYKCDICERAFEHSGKLHRHMRIHTGERPHKCGVCSKTFIQSGQLVIHMRTHTGEKPYVCKDCGKGFTCSKQLKVHNRTHTGEKPYSCDICGKSFGYNHVLKLHQVAHYGEKVYKCTICNETFTSKKTMESHIKTHSESATSRTEDSPVAETETSSCASSSSDKENKETYKAPESPPRTDTYSNIRDICEYLYRPDKKQSYQSPGLNPALLAAVAVATSENQTFETEIIAGEEQTFTLDGPSVYIMQDDTLVEKGETTSYVRMRASPELILLPATQDEERDILTPPSSNPVSPVHALEPMDVREMLILPPRKRSKAILKSMESEREVGPVRYNSVIHYAKAS